MSHKVTWDRDAPLVAVVEAVRRVFVRDGIPRHVYADGRIMKYDWQLSSEQLEDSLEGEALEQHIGRLIKEQHDRQD